MTVDKQVAALTERRRQMLAVLIDDMRPRSEGDRSRFVEEVESEFDAAEAKLLRATNLFNALTLAASKLKTSEDRSKVEEARDYAGGNMDAAAEIYSDQTERRVLAYEALDQLKGR